MKLIAKAAYEVAKKEANQGCGFFFYQKKLPGKVAALRKF
ncbi:AgrD family cyclic lactone autoinducer peptide [[Clostridium] polysaccharolyticum]|uniref:Cyclic lactone autoinducer peptide n=1 Tax=[Clostridium] polysaccharolyticum TaxID=29364 RepID=A0A1H9YK97_9FIRM|nr:cyclic lactone autoinducer peptide [[Clostridium] polysaccharolyticum]SES69498.1 cyclic lactone autoinducer peptide [[Clostridium] polysaccharolyticum]